MAVVREIQLISLKNVKVRHYLLVGGRGRQRLRTTVRVTAAADSGRRLRTLAFDGRGVTAASGAAATVGMMMIIITH